MVDNTTPIVRTLRVDRPNGGTRLALCPRGTRFAKETEILRIGGLPANGNVNLLGRNTNATVFHPIVGATNTCILALLVRGRFAEGRRCLRIIIGNGIRRIFFPDAGTPDPANETRLVVHLHTNRGRVILEGPIGAETSDSFVRCREVNGTLGTTAGGITFRAKLERGPVAFSVYR